MNFSKEVILNLPDVEGEVKAVFSPLSFNVYQNGAKIKKKGAFKPKFMVKTTSGELEPITIRNTKGLVRTAFFRDQQIPLEEKLPQLDQIIAIGTVIAVFVVGCVLIGFIGGALGGALIGFTVAFGVKFNLSFIRQEKSTLLKLLVSLGVSVVCFITYFGIGMMIVRLLHGSMRTMYF